VALEERRLREPRRRFVLQWHVTERCNLRCRHCYQEGYAGLELAFADLGSIVEQFKSLLERLEGETAPNGLQGHINVTGGEPFVREDFFDLLRILAENREHFSYAILTNGTLIDGTTARKLRAVRPKFVQISVEGSGPTNDAVRGRGVLDRAVAALECLRREDVPTVISFTAHGANFREFPDVARLACELGVTRIWADRVVPCGRGAELAGAMLAPEAAREFFEIMQAARDQAARNYSRTEVSMGRALQFLVGGGTPYRCVAGEDLVTVQSNGDLCPCRRMPIRVGNVMEAPLSELYYGSDVFRALRLHRVSDGCGDCRFSRRCRGGLRCLAYAVTGNPFEPDPGCWLAAPAHRGSVGPEFARARGASAVCERRP
jgi:radical SAM protein with 4Fe4S-binding SPASM domain